MNILRTYGDVTDAVDKGLTVYVNEKSQTVVHRYTDYYIDGLPWQHKALKGSRLEDNFLPFFVFYTMEPTP